MIDLLKDLLWEIAWFTAQCLWRLVIVGGTIIVFIVLAAGAIIVGSLIANLLGGI